MSYDYATDDDGNQYDSVTLARAAGAECIRKVYSQLLVDDHHGIYVPQVFFTKFDVTKWGLTEEDVVKDPEDEAYWDNWDQVLNKAKQVVDGKTYHLEQDGDLWARAYEEATEEDT